MLNFRDPSIAFRVVIVALAAISTILLVAGTAVDEYVTNSLGAMGCQKLYDEINEFSYRASFKSMNILSFVIILVMSVLCVLQAAAAALNVLVLLKGTHEKPATNVTSLVTALLLLMIVLANVNFTTSSSEIQLAAILGSEGYAAAALKSSEANGKKSLDKWGKKLNRWGDEAVRDAYGGLWRRKKRSRTIPKFKLPKFDLNDAAWGPSYELLAAAFSFAVMNQLLLLAIQHMSKNGISSFGAVKDKILATIRDRAFLIKLGITILNLLMFVLMAIGTGIDRYVSQKGSLDKCVKGTRLFDCNAGAAASQATFAEMLTLAFVLLVVTCVVCVLLFVASVLCIMQLKKDKVYTMPLLGVSGISTVLLLASIVLACINFTAKRYFPWADSVSWQTSFTHLCTSFAFSILNTGLNVLNMIQSKNGRGGFGASFSKGTATSAPSSGPPPSQPSSVPQPSSN